MNFVRLTRRVVGLFTLASIAKTIVTRGGPPGWGLIRSLKPKKGLCSIRAALPQLCKKK